MEWKPIKLDNVQIKQVYEISENGDIRRLDNGKVFTGGERIMLTLVDGTHKHFFRQALVNSMFHDDDMWKQIKLNGVKPIYEISKRGDIRRLDTGRVFVDSDRTMLISEDGTNKYFLRQTLIDYMFHEDDTWKPIKLDNVQLKPIYEITRNGDVRRTDTGRTLNAKYYVDLMLTDGTYQRFLRTSLTESIFESMSVEWRPIKIDDGLELSCQYLISEDGHLCRANTNRRLKYNRIYGLTTKDHKIRKFSAQKLVRMAFPEVNEMLDEHALSILLQSLNGFISMDCEYSHVCIAISIREKNTITLSHEKFDATIRVHYDGARFIVNMPDGETIQSNRKVVESMIMEYITEVFI